MTTVTNCQRLLLELQSEIIQFEVENAKLKEMYKQKELQNSTTSDLEIRRVDWIELEPGKRFLTKKIWANILVLQPGQFQIKCQRVFSQ